MEYWEEMRHWHQGRPRASTTTTPNPEGRSEARRPQATPSTAPSPEGRAEARPPQATPSTALNPQGRPQAYATAPERVPTEPTEPTDAELRLFVLRLRNALTSPGRIPNQQMAMVYGDYLLKRDVLARLQGRPDYVDLFSDPQIAGKLGMLLHMVARSTVTQFYAAMDEGKISGEDVERWKQLD